MSSSGNHTANAAAALAYPPEQDERRALVQRIALSRHFAKAHQLREILLYLVERALADPATPIHEQEIACSVLGRKPDFNPHEDNIVRVQVSHLRKRLEEYFGGEGLGESTRVLVPKGGYTLRFEQRTAPAGIGTEDAPASPLREQRALHWNWRGLAAALLVIGIVTAWFVWAGQSRHQLLLPHSAGNDLLWPRLFAGPATNIVVADTCLVMLQDLLDTDIPLPEYLTGRYPESLLDKLQNKSLQHALRLISTRQYTSLADLNSAQRLTEVAHRYSNVAPAIRYARHMNVRDFKTGNFILAGSRRGIPWVQLFESQLNFSMEEDLHSRTYFYRNKNPRPGEQAAWYQEKRADATVETYADIALVPNLGNNGYVLIFSGIGMEAAEAAGEFAAGTAFEDVLSGLLPKVDGRPQLRSFEILLRTRAVAGAVRNSQVVTSRVLAGPLPGS